MAGGIYLMRDDGELVEMNERGYDSESLLQGYLSRHHDLLAGDQIDGNEPRRWLLVSQEMPLASEEDGSGRWSVDHLFLDQDAVPTIIETKRSTDTRIRREVVGQMLDYAANGVTYWSVEKLRAQFEIDIDSEERLLDFLQNPDADSDEFWREVEGNLQRGRVRLVFVSDRIPDELRRIVEFLNEQMSPAEVLAVEIKQYVSDDNRLRTLVPRVIGQTTKAKDHKSTTATTAGRGRLWNEYSFFEEVESRVPGAVVPTRAIFEWSNKTLSDVSWGKGAKFGLFKAVLRHQGSEHKLFEVWTDGYLYVNLGKPESLLLFKTDSKRSEFLLRLDDIPGVDVSSQAKKKSASIPLSVIDDDEALEQLLTTMDWFVEEVRGT